MAGKTVTLYLDVDLYEGFKALCGSRGWGVSQKMNDLMRALLEEEGREVGPVDYSRLRDRHLALAGKTARMEGELRKRKLLDRLDDMMVELGLERDVSNLNEVAPKLIEKWKEDPDHIMEDVHVYLTYMEHMKEKIELEARLEEVRSTHGRVP